MGADTTRALRGALAGAVAAGVWALQQPLDRRVFGVDYDDAQLAATLVTGRRRPIAIGGALHVFNGAAFGAAYSVIAPSVGVPAALRGLAAGVAEHLATWPYMRRLERRPAGEQLPRLWGNHRAFAQALWRHSLFGVLLGVIEHRLNPPPDEAAHAGDEHAASNGHGSVEHLVLA
jgi:hypothetical protein